MPVKEYQFYVYILSSENGTLYIGVTNDLERRVYEHKFENIEGFTKMYHIHRLIYFEETDQVDVAISREKQLKKWSRKKKLALVKTLNPTFDDLSKDWFAEGID